MKRSRVRLTFAPLPVSHKPGESRVCVYLPYPPLGFPHPRPRNAIPAASPLRCPVTRNRASDSTSALGLCKICSTLPRWRNWQTHYLEVVEPSPACRFNSCPGHLPRGNKCKKRLPSGIRFFYYLLRKPLHPSVPTPLPPRQTRAAEHNQANFHPPRTPVPHLPSARLRLRKIRP